MDCATVEAKKKGKGRKGRKGKRGKKGKKDDASKTGQTEKKAKKEKEEKEEKRRSCDSQVWFILSFVEVDMYFFLPLLSVVRKNYC